MALPLPPLNGIRAMGRRDSGGSHAAGLTEVILPERNASDLDDVPADVRGCMTFHIVGSVDQVLAHALEPTALAMAA